MIRKLAWSALGTMGLVAALFLLSGRGLRELRAYLWASADQAVDDLTAQLPTDVQDKKLSYELNRLQQELIDRQVALGVTRKQVDGLREEVKTLDTSAARRQRLLVEAYPVLKTAVEKKQTTVRFANTEFTLEDYQRHLDDLMSRQERENRQLAIKREGLARLEKHVREAEDALAQMRQTLEKTEQEVVALRNRRDQAELEAKTLSMLAALNATHESGAGTANGVTRLREDVTKLEARNDARRDVASAGGPERNALGRAYDRLEALKALHQQAEAEAKTAVAQKKGK